MKKIRLCIGSNDEINIADTHMGDTDFFLIYDLYENSENEFIQKRINAQKHMEHAKSEKMKEILKIVNDVDILVARQLSPNFKRISGKTKYQPVVVNKDSISEILLLLHKSFAEIHNLVIRRQNGEVFEALSL